MTQDGNCVRLLKTRFLKSTLITPLTLHLLKRNNSKHIIIKDALIINVLILYVLDNMVPIIFGPYGIVVLLIHKLLKPQILYLVVSHMDKIHLNHLLRMTKKSKNSFCAIVYKWEIHKRI